MKDGALLILLEWCVRPERILGKIDLERLNANIERNFPGVEIPYFKRKSVGYSSQGIGPYIVYQRLCARF